MKVYKIIKYIKDGNGIFAELTTNKSIYWTLNKPEDAEIINSSEECKKYNTLYAVRYNIPELPIKTLMEIMLNELSVSETEQICKKYKWIEEKFNLYLQNPLNDEDVRKKIKSNNSAKDLAALAYINSVLN